MKTVLAFLFALLTAGAAHAACPSPNPNINAPPFVDGCPLPAVALNKLINNTINDVRSFGWSVGNSGAGASNTAACAAAITAANSNGYPVHIPAGVSYLSGPCVGTIPANTSLTIFGDGADVTVLHFTGSDGFDLTLSGAASSVHVRDLTNATAAAGSGTCIALTQSVTTLLTPAFTAQSDITGVTCRGFDGYNLTDYWNAGVTTGGVSNINFGDGDYFGGPVGVAGLGIYLTGGTSTRPPVVFNVGKVSFNNLTYGIRIGPYVQGVTVSPGANFTGDANGIYAGTEVNSTNVSQLTVVGSQFGYCVTACINLQGLVQNVFIDHDLFLMVGNDYAITTGASEELTINGNQFLGIPPWPVGLQAMFLGPTTNIGGAISGNIYLGINIPIGLATGATGFRISGDFCQHTGQQYVSTDNGANTGNYISGICSFGTSGTSSMFELIPVTGTTNNGGLTQVTTSASLTGLATGTMVTAYLGGGPTNNFGISRIQINDTSHFTLLDIPYSGAWSSGGFVSLMP